jgi:hypothetical protein
LVPEARVDDRHTMVNAGADDQFDLVGGIGKHHRIGQLAGNVRGGMGVLGAYRLAGLELITKSLAQYADHRSNALVIAKARLDIAQTHLIISRQTCFTLTTPDACRIGVIR